MKLTPELEAQVLMLAGVNPVPLADLTEEQFLSEVLRLARRLGWHAYHTRDSRKSAAGFPDCVFARAPRLFVAELKVGDNQPTAAQLTWLEQFQAASIPAYVWRPTDWQEIERTLRGDGTNG